MTRHVTGFDSALDGAVLTTQLDGTEAAIQANPRLAGPEAAGISQTAVVGVGFVFQVEDGFQAIAQFFGTDDADLGTTPDAIIDLQVALARAAGVFVQALDSHIDATGQLDAGLSLGECRHSCHNGQRNKRFFHWSIS